MEEGRVHTEGGREGTYGGWEVTYGGWEGTYGGWEDTFISPTYSHPNHLFIVQMTSCINYN